jgi:hypothetical protein
MDDGMLNGDSESMFLNDLFGDGLDTDAVLANTSGRANLGGLSDPATSSHDFDIPDSPENNALGWAGDDQAVMEGGMAQPTSMLPTPRGNMQLPGTWASAPAQVQGQGAASGSGRAGKPPSSRASTGGGRKRSSAAAQAQAAAAAAAAAQAVPVGQDNEDVAHGNAHTHIDVNVNTDNSHTRISVTTGQVKFMRSVLSAPLRDVCLLAHDMVRWPRFAIDFRVQGQAKTLAGLC